MNYLLAAFVALSSTSALAAGYASRPAGDYDQPGKIEGLYAGVSGGGQLMIFGGNNAFGYDVEARLGYSFSPMLTLYLSGALDGATFSTAGGDISFKAEQLAVFLQYHLLVKPAVMVYARAGIGVGLSGDYVQNSMAAGLGESGGLGVEIRIGPGLFLAPELFYRGATLSAQGFSDSYQSIGLQIGLIYY